MNNTDTITGFVTALEQLEIIAYEIMSAQEDSFNSPYNKVWRLIKDAHALASELPR